MSHHQYALINPDNLIERMSFRVDPTVDTKPGWRWIIIVDEERPPYDPETHVAEGTVDIQETQVLRGWIIREKTIEEHEAERTTWVNNIERAVITALHNQENRLLILEGQPTITLEEYKIKLRDIL